MKKQLPFFIAILGLSVAGLSQEQEPLATPEIIFRDTFDRASTTFDVNEVASERQVGRVAPLNYTESGETASGKTTTLRAVSTILSQVMSVPPS